jgi:hypothetical protein
MCRSVRVRLSPSERQDAARLTGILLPVYASIVLLLAAGVYVTHAMRGGTLTAASQAARSPSTAMLTQASTILMVQKFEPAPAVARATQNH